MKIIAVGTRVWKSDNGGLFVLIHVICYGLFWRINIVCVSPAASRKPVARAILL